MNDVRAPSTVFHLHFGSEYHYPVHFTRRVLDPANPLLAETLHAAAGSRPPRAAVYLDAGFSAARPALASEVTRYCEDRGIALAAPPNIVPGGERIKHGMAECGRIVEDLIARRLDRQSYVIAIGGGAVLDVVGLAAALAHRGLRTVRLPSTTLAQNDAGIGVKTGLNLAGQKNAVGVFAPPWAVIDDFDFLDTLDDENWIAGHAEAFKVAAIRDAAFFDFLCAHASALRRRDPVAQEQAVTRCAERHLRHIRDSGDPFETGTARPLDFGHWAAHQLETMTGYALRHGPAVAIGVALDAAYARRKGWLTPGDFERLTGGLRACGFTLWHPAMAERRPDGVRVLFEGIEKFREHLGGELTITMPRGIGDRFEIHDLDRAVLDACADELREPKAFSPC